MQQGWIALLAAAYVGAISGSFLNVVIFRYISGEAIGLSRSHCPKCRHVLAWYDLVPILSYVMLRARCRYCKDRIALQYPIVELSAMIAAVSLASVYSADLKNAVLVFIIFMILLALFVIDLRTFILPDFLVVLLSVIVVLHHGLAAAPSQMSQLGGLLVGSGFLLALWIGTKGRGIGFGDVKLLIPLGLLFGVEGVVPLLFYSFMAGGVVGGVLLALKKATPKTAIPFGPFLAGAAMIALIYPQVSALFWELLLGG